jgi:hypothetical protein
MKLSVAGSVDRLKAPDAGFTSSEGRMSAVWHGHSVMNWS